MKVLLLNSICGSGSTGRICTGIADVLKSNGHEAYIAYGQSSSTYPNSFNISEGRFDYLSHNILSRLTDSEGLHSNCATKRLIKIIEDIMPDIVHIHTLHGHYVNYKLLFEYLIKNKCINVVMTLHDCWTFTGHCAHFVMHGCEKWKNGCYKCDFLNEYPKSWFIDKSKSNYNLKKRLITQLEERLTIVPVSYWLENLLRESFLKDLRIKTLHNGIDLNIFKPTYNEKLDIKYGLQGKKIVLGVASPWSGYKGLPDFYKLRSRLSDDYAIIMVGLSEQQIMELPDGIVGICRTDNVNQLSELYTIADVFVNTTYCDNYPTVNLEAISCGTPVITYKTGGSPESVDDMTGRVVEQGNIEELSNAIIDVCRIKGYFRTNCLNKAKAMFDKDICFMNYLNLYNELLNS